MNNVVGITREEPIMFPALRSDAFHIVTDVKDGIVWMNSRICLLCMLLHRR
jgi:hypothetical protein